MSGGIRTGTVKAVVCLTACCLFTVQVVISSFAWCLWPLVIQLPGILQWFQREIMLPIRRHLAKFRGIFIVTIVEEVVLSRCATAILWVDTRMLLTILQCTEKPHLLRNNQIPQVGCAMIEILQVTFKPYWPHFIHFLLFTKPSTVTTKISSFLVSVVTHI